MELNLIGKKLEYVDSYVATESITTKIVKPDYQDKSLVFVSVNSPYLAVGATELKEYLKVLEKVESDNEVAALVLTDVSDNRIVSFAGANVKEFKDLTAKAVDDDKEPFFDFLREGQKIVEKTAEYKKPLIGALRAAAYGGGAELLMLTYLVASEDAKLILPETTLDVGCFLKNPVFVKDGKQYVLTPGSTIFPGWHGTRSGPYKAIEKGIDYDIAMDRHEKMLVYGFLGGVSAYKGLEYKLIDEVVPYEKMFEHILVRAYELAAEHKPKILNKWYVQDSQKMVVELKNTHREKGIKHFNKKAPEDALPGLKAAYKAAFTPGYFSWEDAGKRDAVLFVNAILESVIEKK